MVTISQEKNPTTGLQKSVRLYAVILLLLTATILRLIYGHGLIKKFGDEQKHLSFSRSISVQAGKIYLPLGSTSTHHPVLTSYITAISAWLAGGSIYGIRVVYILFSVFGLLGLFYLCRELFGSRAAVIALFLGAFDHHLISYAPEFLEPVYLCLVPWVLLLFYKAVAQKQENYWILLGFLMGLGYLCSEIFLLLGIPILFFTLFSGKAGDIFRSSRPYTAVVLFLLIISPYFIWNYQHEANNIVRHAERIHPIGLTPRLLLLYLGDLFINLKDSSEVVMELCHSVYGPWSIPCHYVSGTLYIISLVYSLKYIKNREHTFLFIFFLGIGIPVSILNAKEPWNEIEWGAMTIFPAICLTAWVADRFWRHRAGRFVYALIFLVISIYTTFFLAGPKCGYASPFWEKSFLGDMIYHNRIKADDAQAIQLLLPALVTHPDCVIVHYYRGVLLIDPRQKMKAFNRALTLEPHNPLVIKEIALQLIEKERYQEAIQLLSKTIEQGHDAVRLRLALSRALCEAGNYSLAEKHLRTAIRMKPDEPYMYKSLFHILVLQGKFEKGVEALKKYVKSTNEPELFYILQAKQYAELGNTRKAVEMYQKALIIKPDLPEKPAWIIQGFRE